MSGTAHAVVLHLDSSMTCIGVGLLTSILHKKRSFSDKASNYLIITMQRDTQTHNTAKQTNYLCGL